MAYINYPGSNKNKRGRPVYKLSVELFLLDPADNKKTKLGNKTWSADAKAQLMQKGYGRPQREHCTNTEKRTVEFSLKLTNEEFKQNLVEIYPKLENACFVFMEADGRNQLKELNPGRCYECCTPDNVYHSKQGQGKLYIRMIAKNEILPCTHVTSSTKRRCPPILPKPVPAVPASIGVPHASGKNMALFVAKPTNWPLAVSGMTGIDLRQSLCNTQVLRLLPPIVVAHTGSTPQRPLSAVTFVHESRPPVSISGNSTVQGPSPESAIDSGTETIPQVHTSGNMVPVLGNLTLSSSSIVVPQTESTSLFRNYGNMVANGLNTSINESRPPYSSPGDLTAPFPNLPFDDRFFSEIMDWLQDKDLHQSLNLTSSTAESLNMQPYGAEQNFCLDNPFNAMGAKSLKSSEAFQDLFEIGNSSSVQRTFNLFGPEEYESEDESMLPVSVSGNSTAQCSSPSSAVVSGIERIPPVVPPMVPQRKENMDLSEPEECKLELFVQNYFAYSLLALDGFYN